MDALTDLDLILPLFQKLSKKGREDFFKQACMIYPTEIWDALQGLGMVDFSSLKRWGQKIPP
jgi:hypothetical protein